MRILYGCVKVQKKKERGNIATFFERRSTAARELVKLKSTPAWTPKIHLSPQLEVLKSVIDMDSRHEELRL